MAKKPTERKVLYTWPAQYALDHTLHELVERFNRFDETKAMEEPDWYVAEEVLIENDFMERAERAVVGSYELNARMVYQEHLNDPSVPIGMPRISWSLYIGAPYFYAITGGPADDFAQAKRFAQMAYQATYGVVVGKDNKLIIPSRGDKLPPLGPPPPLPLGIDIPGLTVDSKPAETKAKPVRRRPRSS